MGDTDRRMLIATNPIAHLLAVFLDGDDDTLDIVFGVPGTTLGEGMRFVEIPGFTPEKMHQQIYGAALRAGWLKKDLWLRKRGNTVTVYKYNPRTEKA